MYLLGWVAVGTGVGFWFSLCYRRLEGMAIPLLLAACSWPDVAHARPPCLARPALVAELAARYGEAPTAVGLTSHGTALEVFKTRPGDTADTFTLIETRPNGISCILIGGTSWEAVQLGPLDAPTGSKPYRQFANHANLFLRDVR